MIVEPCVPTRAYVGLGSNLQDPAAQVRRALVALDEIEQTHLVQASRLYRTPPWGRTDQPDFVNAVAALDTALTATQLLAALQSIEQRAGRERVEHWGPRLLDLDLLLFGRVESQQPDLTLPHSLLARRAFVLLPLAEIAPALEIPGQGPVRVLLDTVDCSGIEALG
jgi:2-amino-4-hydroxy-6-hydroxymethyldihydropteridine diphosphokinase